MEKLDFLPDFMIFGFRVSDLPRCACGGADVDYAIQVEFIDGKPLLVAHVECADCGVEPPFADFDGKDAQGWHEAMLRAVNVLSEFRGGPVFPAFAVLPDQLGELVDTAEAQLGPLPEFREKVLAKHRRRRLN